MWAGHTRAMIRSVVIGHSVHGAVRVCAESGFSSSAPLDMWACQELLSVMSHSAAFLSPVPRSAAGGVRRRGRSPWGPNMIRYSTGPADPAFATP